MQGLYIHKLRVPNLNAGRSAVAAGPAERCSSNLHQLPGPLRYPHYILRALSYLYLSYHPIPIFLSPELNTKLPNQ